MVPDLSNHHPSDQTDAKTQYTALMRRARIRLDAARTSPENVRRDRLAMGYENYRGAQQINDASFFAFGLLIEEIVDFRLVEVRQYKLKPHWARDVPLKISPDYRDRMATFLRGDYPDLVDEFLDILDELKAVPVVRSGSGAHGAASPPM